jgi:hypothetical protein
MDWKKVLGTVAPWIGTALGGPLGGMAVEAAANALGLSDKTVDAVKQAISGATPEQMLALKKADQEFAARMQELGFKHEADMEALVTGDRKDARAMQVSTRSWVPAILTGVLLAAFNAALAALFLMAVPEGNRDIVVYMIGQLSGFAAAAVAYWLGTTRNSQNKTDLLAAAPPVR